MRASFDRSPGSIWSSGSWFPPPDVGVARCFWCFWCFWCFLASGSNAMLPGRLFRCCCVCRDFSPACSSGCARGAAPEVALVPSRLNPKAASESVGDASACQSRALWVSGGRRDDGTKTRRDDGTTAGGHPSEERDGDHGRWTGPWTGRQARTVEYCIEFSVSEVHHPGKRMRRRRYCPRNSWNTRGNA